VSIQRRYCGALVIEIRDEIGSDEYGRDKFRGRIVLPSGKTWNFSSLTCRGDASRAAEAAISFGSCYTSDNRGSDVPEWAPPPEIANEIDANQDYAPEGVTIEIEGVEVLDGKVICGTRAAQKEFYAFCEKTWADT